MMCDKGIHIEGYPFASPQNCKDAGIKRLNVHRDLGRITWRRVQSPTDIVPKVGASQHWQTDTVNLPTVKGFDHTHIRESLEEAIRLEREQC